MGSARSASSIENSEIHHLLVGGAISIQSEISYNDTEYVLYHCIPVDTIVVAHTMMAVACMFSIHIFVVAFSSNAHRSYAATVQIIAPPRIQMLLMYLLGCRSLPMDIATSIANNSTMPQVL
jgi:hypothetical protein